MAGAGKKTFTAGETLTASDVNTYLMEQSVMVFAGTAARSSAIPTPSDGMVTYNQTNNSLEAYNGTEWINKSGLQLVKKQTIGTGVSTINVTNAFNATYENYKILISGGAGNTTGLFSLRLGSSTTGYYFAGPAVTFSSSAINARVDNNASYFFRAGGVTTNGIAGNIELINPFLAKYTHCNAPLYYDTEALISSGYHASAVSYTDFSIIGSGVTLTGGTIYVYGYGV